MNALDLPPARRVARALWLIHRPAVVWFWGIITAVVVVLSIVEALVRAHEPFDTLLGMWMLIASTAGKWWLLAIGLMAVTLHLRTFVANGITRRAFLAGSAIAGLGAVVLFAGIVLAGNLIGEVVGRSYLTFADLVLDFGNYLPTCLAYLVSGVFLGIGFYRFHPAVGIVLIAPAIAPLVVAEYLHGITDPGGFDPPPVPYLAGLPITLAVVAVCALLVWRLTGDVAIRRTV